MQTENGVPIEQSMPPAPQFNNDAQFNSDKNASDIQLQQTQQH